MELTGVAGSVRMELKGRQQRLQYRSSVTRKLSILLSLFPCGALLGGSLSPTADHFANTLFAKPYISLGLLMEVS